MVSKRRFKRVLWIAFVSGLLLLILSPAHANMGVPMFLMMLPASWFIIIPIILIEAIVAVYILNKKYWEAVKLSSKANLISTFVGIPITWVILVFAQQISGGGEEYGLTTSSQKLYAVIRQFPWLFPYGKADLEWMIPAAAALLCVPFFFASVLCEFLVIKRITDNNVSVIKRWAWIANSITYGMIILFLIVLVVRNLK